MIVARPDESKRLERRARRLARKFGYAVRKSRQRQHCNNLGLYMLVDVLTNCVVYGSNFDVSAAEIIEFLWSQLSWAAKNTV